jgi:hypothetical protein
VTSPGPWTVGQGFPDTVATVFQAGDTIINSKGVFVYAGVPGAGNLIASIAGAAGTDQFGNPYRAGTFSYDPADQAVAGLFDGQLLSGFTTDLLLGQIISGGGLMSMGGGENSPGDVPQSLTTYSVQAGGEPSGFADLTQGNGLYLQPDSPATGTNNGWNPFIYANGWADAAGRTPASFRIVPSPARCIQVAGSSVVPAGFNLGQIMGRCSSTARYEPTTIKSFEGRNVTTNVPILFSLNTLSQIQYQGGAAAAGNVFDWDAIRPLDI